MPITLSNLKPPRGSRRRSKRLGRGNASGKGTYSGRGIKGQRARSGGKGGLKRIGLKRILQRIPKHRGFTSVHGRPAVINVGALEERFNTGTTITPGLLVQHDLIQNIKGGVKILGDGKLTKAFTVKGCAVSKPAREKIEAVGGRIEN